MATEPDYSAQREAMVREQLAARGITDRRVLAAMRHVPRHAFVPPEQAAYAYHDGPLPIGQGQTISQPYIVALMTQMLELQGDETVLEIGTGCGYQTAVLCELSRCVYSVERLPRLAHIAGHTLNQLGYNNVDIHLGDGSQGLPDMHPFDAILVTAVAPSVPGPLTAQIRPETGRMVVPVGQGRGQHLMLVRRHGGRVIVKRTIAVRFVPLLGRYGFREPDPDQPDDPSAMV